MSRDIRTDVQQAGPELARHPFCARSPKILSPTRTLLRNVARMSHDANCIFCKIVDGKIPSMKLYETDKSYAFLDIGPCSPGHSLVIPKYHAAKMHELPDEYLQDILPIAKKVAIATGAPEYNILQNNGRLAHQVVDHVHCTSLPLTPQSTSSRSPRANRAWSSVGHRPSHRRRSCKPYVRFY